MKRPAAQEKTLARIKKWREQCPELTLRSTFIVGFPGETDSDFAYLLDWLDEAEIDRLGCFKYEPVAGAPSNAIGNAVPDEIKQERWNALMARQQKISARRLKRKVGTRQQVIIDEVGPTVAKGRSKADAPEIDGAVYLSSRRPCASAKSSPQKSSAPTNTICTAASRDSDLGSAVGSQAGPNVTAAAPGEDRPLPRQDRPGRRRTWPRFIVEAREDAAIGRHRKMPLNTKARDCFGAPSLVAQIPQQQFDRSRLFNRLATAPQYAHLKLAAGHRDLEMRVVPGDLAFRPVRRQVVREFDHDRMCRPELLAVDAPFRHPAAKVRQTVGGLDEYLQIPCR